MRDNSMVNITKKSLLLLILLYPLMGLHAQIVTKMDSVTDHSSCVVGSNFRGVVFSDKYFPVPGIQDIQPGKRFTPSFTEISTTEQVFQQNLRKLSRKKGALSSKNVNAHLDRYLRQYIGYIDSLGNKVVIINGFLDDDDWALQKDKLRNKSLNIPVWLNRIFMVFDGGDAYIHAAVNINSEILLYFGVNGVG